MRRYHTDEVAREARIFRGVVKLYAAIWFGYDHNAESFEDYLERQWGSEVSASAILCHENLVARQRKYLP